MLAGCDLLSPLSASVAEVPVVPVVLAALAVPVVLAVALKSPVVLDAAGACLSFSVSNFTFSSIVSSSTNDKSSSFTLVNISYIFNKMEDIQAGRMRFLSTRTSLC